MLKDDLKSVHESSTRLPILKLSGSHCILFYLLTGAISFGPQLVVISLADLGQLILCFMISLLERLSAVVGDYIHTMKTTLY